MVLNNLDLNKLNTFMAVAENGGISGAAAKLWVTRSAVSQSVSALEKSLDVSLFNRVGKKLVLTPQGERLYEGFRVYHQSLQKTVESLGAKTEEAVGLVKVGLFTGFSGARITNFVSDFLAAHAAVQVKILFLPQSDLGALLRDGKIDFALSIYPLDKEFTGVESLKLFEEELVMVAAKKRVPAAPALGLIQALPFVEYYQSSHMVRRWIKHHFKKDMPNLDVRAYGAAIDFVLDLILNGVGAGIVPRYVAAPHIEKGRLFQIKTGRNEIVDYIWLNKIKNVKYESAADLFLRGLFDRLGDLF